MHILYNFRFKASRVSKKVTHSNIHSLALSLFAHLLSSGGWQILQWPDKTKLGLLIYKTSVEISSVHEVHW